MTQTIGTFTVDTFTEADGTRVAIFYLGDAINATIRENLSDDTCDTYTVADHTLTDCRESFDVTLAEMLDLCRETFPA